MNDSTYLLLSSLAVESLRKANLIKALAINLNLARPDKDPGFFLSSSRCLLSVGQAMLPLPTHTYLLCKGTAIVAKGVAKTMHALTDITAVSCV